MLLQMLSITKDFPGVRALDNVNFDLIKGECHALVGENGAGKSTLMKILSGVYPFGSYSGEILVEGKAKRFYSVKDAEASGIGIIFQELSLVKDLSIAENIFLGSLPSNFGIVNRDELNQRATQLLKDLHLFIDPSITAGDLSIGKQQIIEIAKALSKNAKILVLDEPTSALTDSETEVLFEIIRKLKAKDVGLIYISHKLEEVFSISERITVLRDGKTVLTKNTKDTTKEEIIAHMVGRQIETIFPKTSHKPEDEALRVENFSVYNRFDRKVVSDVSFFVRKGEVLGIAGLIGAGRSELLMGIFGAWQGKTEGLVFLDGRRVSIKSPTDAIRVGIGFVTEDRKRYGLVLEKSIQENVTLASLKEISKHFLLDKIKEIFIAKNLIDSLHIKTQSPTSIVATLSGGNQQKVVLAKWLLTKPKILFLDEPTRGIDVAAKQEFYLQIDQLAKQGLAIVLVSSELPEILGLSDRILVMHEGKLTAEFDREQATPEKIMMAATGYERKV